LSIVVIFDDANDFFVTGQFLLWWAARCAVLFRGNPPLSINNATELRKQGHTIKINIKYSLQLNLYDE